MMAKQKNILLWEDMSFVAMNGLYKNHVLAKQNRSSRQARCVATSNWHMHFLPLFVTCYKCFVTGKVSSLATHKVKTFTDHTVQGHIHVQCQWLTFIKNSTTHLFILVRNNKLFISCFGFFGCENFYDTAPVNLFKTLETFSIRFFIWNCKPQTTKCHVNTPLRSRLQFAVHVWTTGRFFATKNCTASRLKVWTSFLYPFAMCLLDCWPRINELLLIFGRLKWCTSTWRKQHGSPKQWTHSSNRFYVPFCCTNKRKYSVPIQSFFFLSFYWIHNLTQSLFSSYF